MPFALTASSTVTVKGEPFWKPATAAFSQVLVNGPPPPSSGGPQIADVVFQLADVNEGSKTWLIWAEAEPETNRTAMVVNRTKLRNIWA